LVLKSSCDECLVRIEFKVAISVGIECRAIAIFNSRAHVVFGNGINSEEIKVDQVDLNLSILSPNDEVIFTGDSN